MVVLGGKLREYKWIWWVQYKTWVESWCVPSFPWILLHGFTSLVVLHGNVAMEYSRLKVLGSGQLFQRWLRHLFHSEKHISQIYLKHPMCLKMAQPYMCKMRKIVPSTSFKILRSGKDFWVIKTLMKRVRPVEVKIWREKNNSCIINGATTWDNAIQLLLKNLANNRPKGNNPTATIDRTNSWVRVPRMPWTPGSNMSE